LRVVGHRRRARTPAHRGPSSHATPPLEGNVSDADGRRAAAIYSLIERAKLNGLNPQRYLTDLLARIADHPARHIAELLPWNWQPLDATRAAA
jgi:transposase IS66-like protein